MRHSKHTGMLRDVPADLFFPARPSATNLVSPKLHNIFYNLLHLLQKIADTYQLIALMSFHGAMPLQQGTMKEGHHGKFGNCWFKVSNDKQKYDGKVGAEEI